MEENVESNKVSHILSEARESCQRSGGANAVSCLLGYSSLSLALCLLFVKAPSRLLNSRKESRSRGLFLGCKTWASRKIVQALEVPWRLEGADGRLEHCGVVWGLGCEFYLFLQYINRINLLSSFRILGNRWVVSVCTDRMYTNWVAV